LPERTGTSMTSSSNQDALHGILHEALDRCPPTIHMTRREVEDLWDNLQKILFWLDQLETTGASVAEPTLFALRTRAILFDGVNNEVLKTRQMEDELNDVYERGSL